MQSSPTKAGLHPMLWVAAIAITLFSLVGIAALTGIIPKTTFKAEEVATSGAQESIQTPPNADPPPSAASQDTPSAPNLPPARDPGRESVASQQMPQAANTDEARQTTRSTSTSSYPSATPVALCANCGVVESVKAISAKGEGTGMGAIAGGVVGGVLGHQVGKGSGNTLATIAGAVAGGYAGHQVEKNVRTSTQYEIAVRMDDGRRRVLTRKAQPQWRQGDRVEVSPDGEISAAPQSNTGRASF